MRELTFLTAIEYGWKNSRELNTLSLPATSVLLFAMGIPRQERRLDHARSAR